MNDIFAAADAVARLSRMLERAAAPLSLADFRVLSSIEAGEVRASRLAQRLAVGKPAISATVDSLAKRGLILRTKFEDDQRVIALALTEEGAAEFALAKERLVARVSAVTDATHDPAASIRTLAELGEAIERVQAAREAAASATTAPATTAPAPATAPATATTPSAAGVTA
ncbi:MarR family winged helix-turn-helix transcriptional regulator [Gryllotalpicola reticulitermitis]|uniref:MarR family winged helix-turn-helix transcriptional regulator n=1 Tax=Gryllotalpicola reticulitermitis TaxID=1184153 RepID=A0ABV8Q988_9MICO